ncbi:MAG TPA: hypothetical protein VHQ93_09665 [Chitinophagaceae bacterium]|jgi:hypothetical protein|nr:hypothetical protein [Chitinophagaceae bacterium]
MKKIFLFLTIVAGSIIWTPASAQVRVNINIGSQPVWGPVGYDHVDYYYLPDIETYYYVPARQFVYFNNGRWIYSSSLPYRYRNYDLNRGYKVVINQPRPYQNFSMHRAEYSRYRNYGGRQMIIRNSNDPRYYLVKGHPRYYRNRGRD